MVRVVCTVAAALLSGCIVTFDPGALDGGGGGLDSGGVDAGTSPDRGDLEDTGGRADVPLEIDAGPCFEKACCTWGCFDGFMCQPGTAQLACGAPGGRCAACSATQRCAEDICAQARVIETVAAGRYSSCVIDSEGALLCFGNNQLGRIGLGTTFTIANATVVAPGAPYGHAALNGSYSGFGLGVSRSGALFGWGNNSRYQLATGAMGSEEVLPVPALDDGGPVFTHVTAGGQSSCALRGAGELHCWGDAGEYAIPFGRTEIDLPPSTQTAPLRFGTASDFVSVGLGDGYGCALHASGLVECWGRNTVGQLGRVAPSPSPAGLVGPGYTAIGVGPGHACGIHTGTVMCWGANDLGQCGVPASASVPLPTRVMLPREARAVAAGRGHTCAIDIEGSLYCWGSNAYGELGLGEARVGEMAVAPTEVPLPPQRALALGDDHTLAVSESGVLRGWGRNNSSQLTSGDSQPSPALIPLP